MYLISVYFDEQTTERMKKYIDHVAKRSGNTFMKDKKVPPHLTVSAFETKQEERVAECLKRLSEELEAGKIMWCSVGTFLPSVIYLMPVFNAYLHELSEKLYEAIEGIEDTIISPYYRPMQWIPHATIGKTLSKEEMRAAFEVLQNEFTVFEGQVVRMGLAKTNPYGELWSEALI